MILALRIDDIGAAIEHYRTVIARDAEVPDARLELAEVLIADGKVEAAEPVLDALLEREPDNLKGRLARLWIRLDHGELEQLEMDIYDLRQESPNNALVQIRIARVYKAMGDRDNARLMLRRTGKNAGFDTDQLYKLALEQLALGDAAGAHWSVLKALEGNARHLGALACRVVVLIALDRLEEAKQALAELKAVYPQRSETRLAEGDLMTATHDLNGAVRAFAAAYRLLPTRATVRRLFEAQIENDDVKGALKTIRVWILLHPDDIDSRHALAEKLISVGRFRPAQLVYEGILKRDSTDPQLLNNLAYVSQKVGDERAVDYARQAVETAPDHPGFLDTYGWILAENGEPERGLKMLRDAYTRQSTNEEIRYHIALALLRLDRHDAARRELDAAVASQREFPSRAEARALLEQLGDATN